MKVEDRPRFAHVLLGLCETFGRDCTEGLIEGYWLALSDLNLDEFGNNAARCLKTSTFMPMPVDLRGGKDENATKAWSHLLKAIRRHGHYASVDFADTAINATVRALGGWDRVCGLESEELHKWYRKDFEKTYTAYALRPADGEAGKHLEGYHEQKQLASGKGKPPTVVRVGDEPKAITCQSKGDVR